MEEVKKQVEDSHSSCTVSGEVAGGLIGTNMGSLVNNTLFNGEVSGDVAGGLIGRNLLAGRIADSLSLEHGGIGVIGEDQTEGSGIIGRVGAVTEAELKEVDLYREDRIPLLPDLEEEWDIEVIEEVSNDFPFLSGDGESVWKIHQESEEPDLPYGIRTTPY